MRYVKEIDKECNVLRCKVERNIGEGYLECFVEEHLDRELIFVDVRLIVDDSHYGFSEYKLVELKINGEKRQISFYVSKKFSDFIEKILDEMMEKLKRRENNGGED